MCEREVSKESVSKESLRANEFNETNFFVPVQRAKTYNVAKTGGCYCGVACTFVQSIQSPP